MFCWVQSYLLSFGVTGCLGYSKGCPHFCNTRRPPNSPEDPPEFPTFCRFAVGSSAVPCSTGRLLATAPAGKTTGPAWQILATKKNFRTRLEDHTLVSQIPYVRIARNQLSVQVLSMSMFNLSMLPIFQYSNTCEINCY